jgi:hypothetical protein
MNHFTCKLTLHLKSRTWYGTVKLPSNANQSDNHHHQSENSMDTETHLCKKNYLISQPLVVHLDDKVLYFCLSIVSFNHISVPL